MWSLSLRLLQSFARAISVVIGYRLCIFVFYCISFFRYRQVYAHTCTCTYFYCLVYIVGLCPMSVWCVNSNTMQYNMSGYEQFTDLWCAWNGGRYVCLRRVVVSSCTVVMQFPRQWNDDIVVVVAHVATGFTPPRTAALSLRPSGRPTPYFPCDRLPV